MPPNSPGGKPDEQKIPQQIQHEKPARKPSKSLDGKNDPPGRKNKGTVGENAGNKKDPKEK